MTTLGSVVARNLPRRLRRGERVMLLVVADAGLRFHRPAAYDDLLRVRTRLVAVSGVRLRFEYEVDRPADGVLVATGHTTLASTDPAGRPVRIPAEMRGLLDGVVEPSVTVPEGQEGGIPPRKNPEGAAVQGPRP